MDNKFEINVDFLAYFRSKGKVEAGDFYESKNIFSVFDKNHDGELDNNEISSIFKQVIKHSDKNNNDTRADAFAIFDEVEAKSFVNETKNKDGKTDETIQANQMTNAEMASANGDTTAKDADQLQEADAQNGADTQQTEDQQG